MCYRTQAILHNEEYGFRSAIERAWSSRGLGFGTKKRDRFDTARVGKVDCRRRMAERDRQTTRTRNGFSARWSPTTTRATPSRWQSLTIRCRKSKPPSSPGANGYGLVECRARPAQGASSPFSVPICDGSAFGRPINLERKSFTTTTQRHHGRRKQPSHSPATSFGGSDVSDILRISSACLLGALVSWW